MAIFTFKFWLRMFCFIVGFEKIFCLEGFETLLAMIFHPMLGLDVWHQIWIGLFKKVCTNITFERFDRFFTLHLALSKFSFELNHTNRRNIKLLFVYNSFFDKSVSSALWNSELSTQIKDFNQWWVIDILILISIERPIWKITFFTHLIAILKWVLTAFL